MPGEGCKQGPIIFVVAKVMVGGTVQGCPALLLAALPTVKGLSKVLLIRAILEVVGVAAARQQRRIQRKARVVHLLAVEFQVATELQPKARALLPRVLAGVCSARVHV